MTSAEFASSLRCVRTHGGEYTVYDIGGDMFEVSAKYVPPIDKIGSGSSGVVCSFLNSETLQKVAIKKIKDAFVHSVRAHRILREIKLLRHLDNENVIVLTDIIRPPRRDDFKDVYIVYECMEHDLYARIKSSITLNPIYFMYQLLRGLKYVHSAKILHRDLTPSNVLLSSASTCAKVKICDFGLARTTISRDGFMKSKVGTRQYRAPELLLNCNDYTAAIDVWSVGCIFMQLLNRNRLFPKTNCFQHLKMITKLIGSPDDSDLGFLESENARSLLQWLPRYEKQPLGRKYPTLNPDAVDLIEKMLVFDPNNRITAEQALNHRYFVTVRDKDDEPVCANLVPSNFDEGWLTVEDIKDLVMMEALDFNPLPNMM